MSGMRVDHVSYAAEHDGLQATADRLAKLIGVDAVDGGVHPRFGTRNVVLPLAHERTMATLAAYRGGKATLVVHSGTIRAALCIALDITPSAALRFVIDPLSITCIDRLKNGWRVVSVNQNVAPS